MTARPGQEPVAETARSEADFRRFGLDPYRIQPWEDGARTDGGPGTYEWWYFDAHLDNGATLVVVFMDKDLVDPGRPLSPLLRLDLTLPDGRSLSSATPYPATEWSAAVERADVRLGTNRFEGDLHRYRIRASAEGVSVDVTLTGEIPPWRPGTGVSVFGPDRDLEFAWLPAVPQGCVTGSYTVDGVTTAVTGVGYHDHNWGNVALPKIVHHWYWARGQAGPYSVIASVVTAVEKYSYEAMPVFMLARDGRIVADDASRVRFETEGDYVDEFSRKPVAAVTRYVYDGDGETTTVTFRRERDLAKGRMVDGLPRVKRWLAKAARFDGAYLRFGGPMTVTVTRNGQLVEEHSDEAVWELMYFGHSLATA